MNDNAGQRNRDQLMSTWSGDKKKKVDKAHTLIRKRALFSNPQQCYDYGLEISISNCAQRTGGNSAWASIQPR